MAISSVLKKIVAVILFITLPISSYALTPAQVFNKVKNSVVVVKSIDAQGKLKSQGSGVLIATDKIATNCHVVEEGSSYQVGRGKHLVAASLYAKDRDKDICILNVSGIKGKPVESGKAANLKVGDPVYAVGAPQGLELSLSDGIVAQLRGKPIPLIQTTAAISPGSSGGGLFDGEGRLVGLTTLYIEGGQNLNFAMPVEWIRSIKPGRKLAAGDLGQTEWLKRAIAMEEAGDWQGLLDWSLRWTKSEPGNAEGWNCLGVACARLKYDNEAIEAFRQALRINPEYDSAWSNLGTIYSRLKFNEQAIEAFSQALRINPEYAEVWYNLGGVYAKSNDIAKAIKAYDQALRINPEYAKAYNNRGLIYSEKLGNPKRAIEDFSKAIEIDPRYKHAYYNRGCTYAEIGDHKRAIQDYDAAIELDLEFAGAYYNRGNSYDAIGDDSRAILSYSAAINIDPTDVRSYNNRGHVYRKRGDTEQAINDIRIAARLGHEKAQKYLREAGIDW